MVGPPDGLTRGCPLPRRSKCCADFAADYHLARTPAMLGVSFSFWTVLHARYWRQGPDTDRRVTGKYVNNRATNQEPRRPNKTNPFLLTQRWRQSIYIFSQQRTSIALCMKCMVFQKPTSRDEEKTGIGLTKHVLALC